MVTFSQDAGASGRYFLTGSSDFSFPRSSNSRIEAAVNCLVIEATWKRVVAEFGMLHSASAQP